MKTFKIIFFGFLLLLIALFFTRNLNILKKEEIIIIKNPGDLLVLVNKIYKLDEKFVPNDLEEISYEYSNHNKYLRKEAKEQFEKLAHDSKELGLQIIAVSAYRDYEYQKQLYQDYVDIKGIDYANMCSAKAGHSEHQTGLVVDVMGENLDYNLFVETKEFAWLKDNAHKYGFILRYPEGREKITGFKYEPWHYRYVGINNATSIYENNLTLEEYLKGR